MRKTLLFLPCQSFYEQFMFYTYDCKINLLKHNHIPIESTGCGRDFAGDS